jgi:hypothetical protein
VELVLWDNLRNGGTQVTGFLSVSVGIFGKSVDVQCWRAALTVMAERMPYPSDLSDERWELIRPVITAWNGQHPSVSGHEGRYDMREIVNAILYQARTGCK